MKRHTQILGRWGEKKAAHYLIKKGYQIVECNIHTPYGEIDLIARHDNFLVFLEVKTRSSSTYGFPEEAITQRKQNNMMASAEAYLQEHCDPDCEWRIDVVAVQKDSNLVKITHFENAITR